jgi:hypothetical protein
MKERKSEHDRAGTIHRLTMRERGPMGEGVPHWAASARSPIKPGRLAVRGMANRLRAVCYHFATPIPEYAAGAVVQVSVL